MLPLEYAQLLTEGDDLQAETVAGTQEGGNEGKSADEKWNHSPGSIAQGLRPGVHVNCLNLLPHRVLATQKNYYFGTALSRSPLDALCRARENRHTFASHLVMNGVDKDGPGASRARQPDHDDALCPPRTRASHTGPSDSDSALATDTKTDTVANQAGSSLL